MEQAKNTKKNALEANKRARAKYNKENIIYYRFAVSKKTDIDVINFIDNLKNKSGFLKEVIREIIKKNG